MKKLKILFLFLCTNLSYAQTPTSSDCRGAIPLCTSLYSGNTLAGQGNYYPEINPVNSCGFPENNTVWYSFTVQTSGDLNFLLTPSVSTDYDFGLYNLTNKTCEDIYFDPTVTVACNASSVYGQTGLTPNGHNGFVHAGTGSKTYSQSIPVNAGESYVIAVVDIYGKPNYTIDFGTSTATIFDNTPPTLDEITNLHCNADTLEFSFSEDIACSSISPSDFTITGPDGTHSIINISGTNCALGGSYEKKYVGVISPSLTQTGTYNLNLIGGSGFVQDACGNVATAGTIPFNFNSACLTSCPVASIISYSDIQCGGQNGTINVGISGGIPSFQFAIDNGAINTTANNNFNFSNLYGGMHEVVVKDNNGCTAKIKQKLNYTTGPKINYAYQETWYNCAENPCSESVAFNINPGGTYPHTYTWSDPNLQGELDRAALCPGTTYSITVTDAKGCTSTTSIAVVASPPGSNLVMHTTKKSDASSCTSADGAILMSAARADGGFALYSYLIDWVQSPSDNSDGFNFSTAGIRDSSKNLPPGKYVVNLYTGPNKNTFCASDTIEIFGPNITGTYSPNAATCSVPGSVDVTMSSGSTPYTYTWNNGSTTNTGISNNSIFTVSSLTTGTYSLTVTDASGCNYTNIAVIAGGGGSFTVSSSFTNASCGQNNGSATITPSPAGSYTYIWSGTASAQTTATANNIAAGTYTVTVNDGGNCSSTTVVTVAAASVANISSVNKNDANCFGGNGNATVSISGGVSGNYTYSWSNGASTITSATSNTELLTANSYTITVIDGSCSTTSVVSITQPTAISFGTPTINNASCGISNGSATIAASGGTGTLNYSWSVSETTANISNKAAGNYIVTVTDANTCTNTLAVNIGSIGGATISSVTKNDANCFGGNGNATVNISGGVSGNYTYSWATGQSTITSNTTSIISNLTAGTYTVTVIDGSCSTTSIVSITQPTAISFGTPTTNSASCGLNNGIATVAASGGTGLLNYSWSATELTATISNKAAGSYIVTVTDANACTSTLAVNIGSSGGAVFSSATTNSPNCNGGNGSATVATSGGVSGNYTYSWSNGASTITTATSNTQLLTANSYTVTVIDGSCSTTTVVIITEPATLAIGVNKTNATCNINNGDITAAVSNGTANYTFVWSSALGYTNTVTSAGVNIINNLTADTYSLIVTDNNACSASTSITITNSGNPIASASATTYEIEEGASTQLTASGGIGYLWTPPTALTCTTCASPTANPTSTTTYTLVIRDIFGCIDSTDITINVTKSCTDEKDVFIANVFSPNNDGNNDVVKIEGNGLTNIYWSIYDRWGNLIFETRNQADGWDGTLNGNTANAGTYVYYLKATCKKTQQEIILKGNISVVK